MQIDSLNKSACVEISVKSYINSLTSLLATS